jgi:hypothetical protein
MPLITGVDHNHRVVSVVAIGPVTVADVQNHVQHVKREHGIGYPELLDARGAAFPSTAEDFEQIAEMVRALRQEGPPGSTAIIVSSEADLDSLRALEVRLEGLCEVKAFRDEQEARIWLGKRARSQSASSN